VETVSLDVRSPQEEERRRFLCRYAPGKGDWHLVLQSLDGLLVLKQQRWGHFVICNPTTRQWINLPELVHQSYVAISVCGFYSHASSGEYRLLCHAIDRHDLESPGAKLPRYYHVLSTGAILPRRLGQAPFISRCGHEDHEDPVAHRGVLHWIVHPQADLTGKMLAFDTASETFRLMSRPPGDKDTMMMALFEHDGELNAAAMHNLTSLNVWVLRGDYKAETWTLRHRVDHLPTPHFYSDRLSVTNVLSVGSGVIVIGASGSMVGRLYDLQEKRVISTEFLFHGGDAYVFTTFLAFNESLVPHAFFDTPRCPDLEPIYFSPQ
jgi:F-box interacting protein